MSLKPDPQGGYGWQSPMATISPGINFGARAINGFCQHRIAFAVQDATPMAIHHLTPRTRQSRSEVIK